MKYVSLLLKYVRVLGRRQLAYVEMNDANDEKVIELIDYLD